MNYKFYDDAVGEAFADYFEGNANALKDLQRRNDEITIISIPASVVIRRIAGTNLWMRYAALVPDDKTLLCRIQHRHDKVLDVELRVAISPKDKDQSETFFALLKQLIEDYDEVCSC